MEAGYLALVLNAHLPFIRHPEYEEFLEEDWFYEAVVGTYVPLIRVFNGLLEEGADFRVTVALSPPLCEMMADDLLQDRCLNYIHKRIELMEKEVHRTRNTPFYETALLYQERFKQVRHLFEDVYKKNLINAFRWLQDAGRLEIMTCAATHGFLPLMATDQARAAQIQVGCQNYEKHFGRPPRGIWLPECSFAPGIETLLARVGIQYFITDTHGLLHASPRPVYGIFAPIATPCGVAAFGRDVESSKQVWSAKEGYPGDWDYREFYRDLGHDADYEYIRPHLHSDGIKRNLGIKYHRITGPVSLGEKQPYDPYKAREKAAEHAGNFMFNRQHQARFLRSHLGRKPIIVAPYDAELFGHWWFEGPEFLDFLFRKIAYDQKDIRTVTLGQYLEENPILQVSTPSASTWGDKGYSEVWLNGSNDWIYRHLHKAEERMLELARENLDSEGVTERMLNQAARELLLAQSSDWAFIMTIGTMTPYAEKRTRDHISRFHYLYQQVKTGTVDYSRLEEVESRDSIFQEIDFRVYAAEE
jgi:1,4-alpha-glucan branching enzyme